MLNTAQLVQVVGSVFNIPTTDAADAAVGTTAPFFAIQIGAVNSLGNLVALSVDGSGSLKVTGAGGSGSNAAAGPTSSAVPSSADYLGVNIGGNLVGVTGFSLTGAKAAAVALVDGSGNQITSFGGGVQFADNAASGATPTGTLSMAWDSANSKVRALKANASQALIVDGSAVTQPVSISGNPTVTVGNASIAVTGTFFQATQPVSIAAAVTVAQPTAANLNATVTGSVSITGTPTVTVGNASLAVTGTFFQATQPVSIAAAVAVTGTFFQSTQPVSIASAVAVTGTFFQVTQPVSAASSAFASGSQVDITNMQVAGGGTVAPGKVAMFGGKTNDVTPQYDIMPLGAGGRSVIIEGFAGGTAVPVSGTFFQATQPVSIAAAVAVTGTFFQATQPVSLATLPALTAGSAVIGHVIVDTAPSTAVTNAGTFAVQATVTQPTAANLQATVTPIALTKATQGATGFSTQDLKDAGRSARIIFLDSFAVAATGETLMTMSYSSDNGTATTGTSYTVTTAKRLRLQSILVNVHTITGNTTAVNVIVRLRVNNAGAALVSSPVQMVISVQGVSAANQAGIPVDVPIPDGWEFVAGAGIGVTVACAGFVTTTAAPKVDISIIGYEY